MFKCSFEPGLCLSFRYDLCAERAACVLSAKIARGTLGPRKERSEGNSPYTYADGTTPSGPNALLQAFTAKLRKNSFFDLG